MYICRCSLFQHSIYSWLYRIFHCRFWLILVTRRWSRIKWWFDKPWQTHIRIQVISPLWIAPEIALSVFFGVHRRDSRVFPGSEFDDVLPIISGCPIFLLEGLQLGTCQSFDLSLASFQAAGCFGSFIFLSKSPPKHVFFTAKAC